MAVSEPVELETPDQGQPAATPANPNLLRDRLANERTFLAWLRTGIAIASLGFVVARFDIFLTELARASGQDIVRSQVAIPLGVILVLAGPIIVLTAAARFLQTERALLGNRPESRRFVRAVIALITLGAVLAGAALVLHLLANLPD